VQEELGRGAFARVYRAVELDLGLRQVAIKVSRHRTGEAAILGKLQHPGVMPVYSVKEDLAAGFTVICMPYLGRATINDIFDPLHGAGKPPEDAAAILATAADPVLGPRAPAARFLRDSLVDAVRWLGGHLSLALNFLHERGICHRDIKPTNVLIQPDGTPTLLDFNLSTDPTLPTTRVGGTVLYMAPEQLRSLVRAGNEPTPMIDAKADIFALGAVLFELLTGAHPFGPIPLHLAPLQVRDFLLEKHAQGCRNVRQLNPRVDAGLARILTRCLDIDPAQRPTAKELARSLHAELGWWHRGRRWLGRHPRTVAAAVILFLGLGAVSAYQISQREPADRVLLRRGLQAFQDQHYEQAIENLNQALLLQPHHPEGVLARGRAHLRLGPQNRSHYGLAMADLQQVFEWTKDPRAQALRGFGMQKQKQPEAAQHFYEQALSAGFTSPELHNNLGSLLMVRAEAEKAKPFLDRALAAKPNLAAAHHNLALWHLNKSLAFPPEADKTTILSELEKGIGHARRAMDLGPAATDLLGDAATLCALAARQDPAVWTEPALDYLNQALLQGLKPAQVEPAFESLRKNGRYQKMVEAARQQPVAGATRATRILDPLGEER
jgi:Flp pilus assembly protein TadD